MMIIKVEFDCLKKKIGLEDIKYSNPHEVQFRKLDFDH